LEIRALIAKSSLKKLVAMRRCMDADTRVRGQLAYYGAFRTGRFAGRAIQPQNFPRPSIKATAAREAIEAMLKGCSADWLRHAYGEPLEVVASCLRGCLVPSAGKLFAIFDLSQIEARVVAWLAGQTDVLQVFARGDDVYVYAQKSLGLNSRLAGKIVTLALGFQMGAAKFQATAAMAGLILTPAEADAIVKAWRARNAKIVRLWWAADRAAKQALRQFETTRKLMVSSRASQPPVSIAINAKLSISVSESRTGRTLMTMRLPSGRRLYYRNASLETSSEEFEAIVYDGVDPKTHRWTRLRTYGGKLVENVTQATARDVIVEAALRIDDRKLGDLVLSAHDELVEEVPIGDAWTRAKLIKEEVDRRPAWALDLPVASEGGIHTRYGK
jgi:DNA polymerase